MSKCTRARRTLVIMLFARKRVGCVCCNGAPTARGAVFMLLVYIFCCASVRCTDGAHYCQHCMLLLLLLGRHCRVAATKRCGSPAIVVTHWRTFACAQVPTGTGCGGSALPCRNTYTSPHQCWNARWECKTGIFF